MARGEGSGDPIPGTWIERVANVLGRRHGLRLEHILDADQALTAWFASGMEPEAAAELDAFDLALAKWLRTFKSRSNYQSWLRLLAADLGYRGPRPTRELLERAAVEPEVAEREIAEFVRSADLKSGTVRTRVIPLSTAVIVLLRAKLAQRLLKVDLPRRDADENIAAPSHQAIFEADRLLAERSDAVSKRTRALLHLAVLGVKPGELVALRTQDIHLRGNCILMPHARVFLSKAAAVALRGWLEIRGTSPGPLFLGFDGRSGRLTDKAISPRQAQRELAKVGVTVGASISPRDLRRRPIVDAESTAIAAKVARVNNAGDLERLRSRRTRTNEA